MPDGRARSIEHTFGAYRQIVSSRPLRAWPGASTHTRRAGCGRRAPTARCTYVPIGRRWPAQDSGLNE